MSSKENEPNFIQLSGAEKFPFNPYEQQNENADPYFDRPEDGLFVVTKFSDSSTSKESIELFKDSKPDSPVPLFHGSRGDIWETISILTSSDHGIIQTGNSASFSISPRSGYWIGGGFIYLVPRGEIVFSDEKQLSGGVRVGDDGLASLIHSGKQETVTLSIYDHKAYLAFGDSNEGTINDQEREVIIAINKSLDEGRAQIDVLRTSVQNDFLDLKSAVESFVPEYLVQQLSELLGSQKIPVNMMEDSCSKTSEILAQIDETLLTRLTNQKLNQKIATNRVEALQEDKNVMPLLVDIRKLAVQARGQVDSISNKKGLQRILDVNKDRKRIDTFMGELERNTEKINAVLEVKEIDLKISIQLFLKKFHDMVQSVGGAYAGSLQERAMVISSALSNLEYAMGMLLEDTDKKQKSLEKQYKEIDQSLFRAERQLEIFHQGSKALSDAMMQFKQGFAKIIIDQDVLISNEREKLNQNR